MRAWELFWTIWLLLSTLAFALITVVVTIKGFGDVRRMLRGISAGRSDEKP